MQIIPVDSEQQIQLVAGLAGEIWRQHFTPIIGAAQVAYMLKHLQSPAAIREQIQQQGFYYLLETDGEAFGYLAFRDEGDGLFLSKFYIRQAERGCGHGRAALQWLEQQARGRTANKIFLTVNRNNKDTITAYRAMGFSISGTQVKDIGGGFVMDDYLMEKIISR